MELVKSIYVDSYINDLLFSSETEFWGNILFLLPALLVIGELDDMGEFVDIG